MNYFEALDALRATEELRARVFGDEDSSVVLARDIRNAITRERIHVIPVGRAEPLHHAHECCWCFPLSEEGGRMLIHNAKDTREKWERNGLINVERDARWVLIYQGGNLNP